MAKHYIAMAGLHGCLPQYCTSCDTYNDAVETLADLHELGRSRRQELKRNGYLALDARQDGNEYCEIRECDCDNPSIHDAQ
jgi:hypothetical protein